MSWRHWRHYWYLKSINLNFTIFFSVWKTANDWWHTLIERFKMILTWKNVLILQWPQWCLLNLHVKLSFLWHCKTLGENIGQWKSPWRTNAQLYIESFLDQRVNALYTSIYFLWSAGKMKQKFWAGYFRQGDKHAQQMIFYFCSVCLQLSFKFHKSHFLMCNLSYLNFFPNFCPVEFINNYETCSLNSCMEIVACTYELGFLTYLDISTLWLANSSIYTNNFE